MDKPKVIGGFRVLGTLGRSGMGVVYRAMQISMGREVALKVLDERVARDPRFSERFLREARISARVNHAHVITVFDGGRDGDILYLAMELVAGGDADRLRQKAGGTLSARRALEIVRDGARGLMAIHAAGLLHRDIKPANLFIAADGAAKLADLGLSRPIEGEGQQLTSASEILGTPAFMSPEQARGDTLDIRSDIYALGATLYALIAGAPPYTGTSAMAVAVQAASGPFPEPAKVPGMPPAVAALIRRTTALDPAKRPADPATLVEACEGTLAQLATGLEVGGGVRARAKTGAGRRGAGRWIAGIGLAAGLVVAGWWVTTARTPVGAATPAEAYAPSQSGAAATAAAVSGAKAVGDPTRPMSDEQWRAEADARAQRELADRAAADAKAEADLRDRAAADARAQGRVPPAPGGTKDSATP